MGNTHNKNSAKKIATSVVFAVLSAILCLCVLLRVGAIGQKNDIKNQGEEPQTNIETAPEPEIVKGMDPIDVIISEVMPSNKATLAMDDGSFPDWLELYNDGTEAVNLEGYILSCAGNFWVLPSFDIAPGEYILVLCDGLGAVENGMLHANFTIPKEGAQLAVLLADGTQIDSLTFENAESDVSIIKNDNEINETCVFPTPGYENTHSGFAAFQSSLECQSSLVIYEVLVYNSQYMPQKREYYDYVELKNISSDSVELSDYYISDKSDNRALFRLPEQTLESGESCYIYCSEDSEAEIVDGILAPFALSAAEERLYLSFSDGSLCDYCNLHDIPLGGSYGRITGENGFFYFESATPQQSNANGFRSVSSAPVVTEGSDGVYDGVESVSISVSGEGTVYYTTDGSTPTENSTQYTGPVSFTETTVFRAISIVPGTLPGETLDLSFIINENHTVPVVSIVMEPEDFKGGNGFYNNFTLDLEKECTAELFDGESGFSIRCGIKLHGATSKKAQEKKSMKLCFRSRYDGELDYDLFENGVTEFSSVLLRAAQEDYYSSMMRDSITHDLAAACFPELPTQDHKYSVVYINGEYWGIYNIREAHSTAHYANHYGYDEDTVTQAKEIWTDVIDYAENYRFAVSNDLSNPDNYEEVCKHLNIDSVIGWCIMEAYTGNMDCHPPNMRFYYSTEDDRMTYALVDLDLGYFENWRDFDVPFEFGYAYNTLADKLTESSEFRESLLTQLSAALTGAMSDENVLALIDKYEAELTPEVARDREKWGGSLEYWQNKMLGGLRSFITDGQGRAKTIANAISARFNLSAETKNRFFSEVK